MTTLLKQDGTASKKLDNLLNEMKHRINGKYVIIHTYSCTKNGRHFNVKDTYFDYKELCELFGLTYEFGNDAPRGGKTGEFIKIKIDKRNRFWKNHKIAEMAL